MTFSQIKKVVHSFSSMDRPKLIKYLIILNDKESPELAEDVENELDQQFKNLSQYSSDLTLASEAIHDFRQLLKK